MTTPYKAYKRVKDSWRWVSPVIIFLGAGASIALILLEVYAVASVIILMVIILGFVLAYFDPKLPRRCGSCRKKMKRHDPKNPQQSTVHYCDSCKTKLVLVSRQDG